MVAPLWLVLHGCITLVGATWLHHFGWCYIVASLWLMLHGCITLVHATWLHHFGWCYMVAPLWLVLHGCITLVDATCLHTDLRMTTTWTPPSHATPPLVPLVALVTTTPHRVPRLHWMRWLPCKSAVLRHQTRVPVSTWSSRMFSPNLTISKPHHPTRVCVHSFSRILACGRTVCQRRVACAEPARDTWGCSLADDEISKRRGGSRQFV